MDKITDTTYRVAEMLQVGDVIPTTHGDNWGKFEVEEVTWNAWRDGDIIVVLSGYQIVNAGCCGPEEMSFRAGVRVEVAA